MIFRSQITDLQPFVIPSDEPTLQCAEKDGIVKIQQIFFLCRLKTHLLLSCASLIVPALLSIYRPPVRNSLTCVVSFFYSELVLDTFLVFKRWSGPSRTSLLRDVTHSNLFRNSLLLKPSLWSSLIISFAYRWTRLLNSFMIRNGKLRTADIVSLRHSHQNCRTVENLALCRQMRSWSSATVHYFSIVPYIVLLSYLYCVARSSHCTWSCPAASWTMRYSSMCNEDACKQASLQKRCLCARKLRQTAWASSKTICRALHPLLIY